MDVPPKRAGKGTERALASAYRTLWGVLGEAKLMYGRQACMKQDEMRNA